LATILAALRYWQREGWISSGHEHDIASNGGTIEPLEAAEIDSLCEWLNIEPAARGLPKTPALLEEAGREIYEFALSALEKFGQRPEEGAADELCRAIDRYLDRATPLEPTGSAMTEGP
jgi:hypothetical protein